ncbi:MAG: exonuclease [Bacteroides sp.]|nr:exonuclease [Bacteroides sp.]
MTDIEYYVGVPDDPDDFEASSRALFPPKRRPMNDNPYDDFVAIDFETMSPQRTSACAIGMVRVIDGVIAQRFYSLINPIRDRDTEKELNFRIHGIPLAEAEKALDFSEMFRFVKDFIGTLPIVCHNRSVDILILERMMEYFGLSGIDTSNNICTYQLTGMSLVDCCKKFGIHLPNHHNALCDAEACARIYLHSIGLPIIEQATGSLKEIFSSKGSRTLDKEYRKKLDDSQISDKSTVFYGATVLITGVFESYPERNDLAKLLQSYGSKIVSSISKKTDLVIVGEGAGPKKLEKIYAMQAEGHPIRIILEPELRELL